MSKKKMSKKKTSKKKGRFRVLKEFLSAIRWLGSNRCTFGRDSSVANQHVASIHSFAAWHLIQIIYDTKILRFEIFLYRIYA